MSASMWQDPIPAMAWGYPALLWGYDFESDMFLFLTRDGAFQTVKRSEVTTQWRHEDGKWVDKSLKPVAAPPKSDDPNFVPEDLDERQRPASG